MKMRAACLSVALALLAAGSASLIAQEKAPPEPAVGIGDVAPDFTLKNQNLEETTLSDFRGKKKVILAFYVFAFTGG